MISYFSCTLVLFFMLITNSLHVCAMEARSSRTTLEELNNIRDNLRKEYEIKNEKLEKVTQRISTALKEIDSSITPLSADDFAKELGFPDAKALDSEGATFNFGEILKRVNQIGPNIQEELKQAQFEQFWVKYYVSYQRAKHKQLMKELETLKGQLSELNEKRSPFVEVETIQTLQKKGIITEKQVKSVRSAFPKSNYAEQVVFIKTHDSCPLVAKIFKNLDSYRREEKQMSEAAGCIQIVNELKTQCGDKLPIIVEYKGSMTIGGGTTGIAIFQKAKGRSIRDIQEKELPQMDDKRVITIFKSIGEQLGNLDALIYRNRDGQQLQPPDPHPENLLFDEKTGQLYWIDYGGIKLEPYKNILKDALFVYNYLPNPMANSPGSFKRDRWDLMDKMKEESPDQQKSKEIELARKHLNMIKKRLLAFQSLYQAYWDVMKKVGVKKVGADAKAYDASADYAFKIEGVSHDINAFNGILKDDLGMTEQIDLGSGNLNERYLP